MVWDATVPRVRSGQVRVLLANTVLLEGYNKYREACL
jgi:hypothetical protein